MNRGARLWGSVGLFFVGLVVFFISAKAGQIGISVTALMVIMPLAVLGMLIALFRRDGRTKGSSRAMSGAPQAGDARAENERASAGELPLAQILRALLAIVGLVVVVAAASTFLLSGQTQPTISDNTHQAAESSGTASAQAVVQPQVAPRPPETILPAVAAWTKKYSEYGSPTAVATLPDWIGGRSQRVSLDGGLVLRFYLVNDTVNIVYEESPGGGLKVFGHYSAPFELARSVQREATDGLPAYTVLNATQNLSGEIAGNILVPSLTRKTPAQQREDVFRRIANREGLLTAAFYSSAEAYEADRSEAYAKSHPSALRKGSTGLLMWTGQFTPGEVLHP